jgi:hypothetical protein
LECHTAGHREDEHDVEVKGFGWLGIRTAYFEQTVALFRDVMNLEVIREEHDVVGLRFPDGTEMEVWRPSDEFTVTSLITGQCIAPHCTEDL